MVLLPLPIPIGKTEKINNEYTLHIKCLPGANKLGKIIPMLKYKYIVEKIIKKEQYTHLIILTTLPGVLINKVLFKQFIAFSINA